MQYLSASQCVALSRAPSCNHVSVSIHVKPSIITACRPFASTLLLPIRVETRSH